MPKPPLALLSFPLIILPPPQSPCYPGTALLPAMPSLIDLVPGVLVEGDNEGAWCGLGCALFKLHETAPSLEDWNFHCRQKFPHLPIEFHRFPLTLAQIESEGYGVPGSFVIVGVDGYIDGTQKGGSTANGVKRMPIRTARQGGLLAAAVLRAGDQKGFADKVHKRLVRDWQQTSRRGARRRRRKCAGVIMRDEQHAGPEAERG